MLLRSFLLSRKKTTANIAKKRLQIIVAERRKEDEDNEPQYLPQMKRELLEVICKYITIDPERLSIQLEKKDEYISILELYIKISEIE